MVFAIVMAGSLVGAAMLFRHLLTTVSAQQECIGKVAGAAEVHEQLKENFSGFVLVADYASSPNTCGKAKHLESWLASRGHRFLTFDGHLVFPAYPELILLLGIDEFPVLVALHNGTRKGAMNVNPVLDLPQNVQRWIQQTEASLAQS